MVSLYLDENVAWQQFYPKMIPIMSEELFTERVYIDPERLLKLKRQRKPFRQVASIFQPPEDPNQSTIQTSSRQPSQLHHNSIKMQGFLQSELMAKHSSANADFIMGILGQVQSEQIRWLQQGDCLSIKAEQRCLLLQGQVKVTGVGGRTFFLSQGALMFINPQTIQKIRQVVCVKPARIVRIPASTFNTLRNYIFIKNAQKIKYLKYCPFFLWTDLLAEDIAACMEMKVLQRGQMLFNRGDPAEEIYFVKEGVVLLERNAPLVSNVFKEYETHYERSEPSPSEATLIVKKGMVLGMDGILMQDGQTPLKLKDGLNPEDGHYQIRTKPAVRVYNARSIGRTQLYSLNRQILEGLFDILDLLSDQAFPKQLSKQDLQRICSDYSEMVVRHRSLPKFSQMVTSREMKFEDKIRPTQELIEKKTKVLQVRQREEMGRKNSIANIIADSRGGRIKDLNSSIVLQHHFTHKLGIVEPSDPPGLAFPRLSSNLRKKRVSKKDVHCQKTQRFIMGWLKCDDPSKLNRQPSFKRTPKDSTERLKLINVRSYRSIVP